MTKTMLAAICGGGPCRVCGKPGPAQMDLCGQLAQIDYICRSCRAMPEEDRVLIYDGLGWRAFIESEKFEELIGPIPESGLYKIDKEAAKKIATDEAKQDESYIKSRRQYIDAMEEADFYRAEAFECERRAEDFKKEAEGIITDYWYELFSEVRA